MSLLKILASAESIIKDSCWKCEDCGDKIKSYYEYIWEINPVGEASNTKTVAEIIMDKSHGQNQCCFQSLRRTIKKKKVLVIKFSTPTDILISANEEVFGSKMKYNSHIETGDNIQTFVAPVSSIKVWNTASQ